MKTSFYFDHDYNARNDQKILELRSEYGWAGYGIYFAIIEVLCESNGEIKRGALGGLSLGLSMDKSELNKMIDFMLAIGLFYEENGTIFSKRVNRHIEFRAMLSEAGKRGGRGNKKPPFSLPKAPPEAGKEIKGDERKEEDINEINNNLPFVPFPKLTPNPFDLTYEQTLKTFEEQQARFEKIAMEFKCDLKTITDYSAKWLKEQNLKGQFPRNIKETNRHFYNSFKLHIEEMNKKKKSESKIPTL